MLHNRPPIAPHTSAASSGEICVQGMRKLAEQPRVASIVSRLAVVQPLPEPRLDAVDDARLISYEDIHSEALKAVTVGLTNVAEAGPFCKKVSSTSPSQSLSMPSHSSVQPPGNELHEALTAAHATLLGPLHTYVAVVRQAPCETELNERPLEYRYLHWKSTLLTSSHHSRTAVRIEERFH